MRTESRKSLLAKIHIAKKDLGLDDDTYRAILERLADQDSAASCTVPQLVQVVAYLRKLGWQGPPAKKSSHGKPAARPEAAGYLDKIEALLAEAKRPWSYAVGIAKRMYHTDKLEWLNADQMRGVLAALSRDAARHGRPA